MIRLAPNDSASPSHHALRVLLFALLATGCNAILGNHSVKQSEGAQRARSDEPSSDASIGGTEREPDAGRIDEGPEAGRGASTAGKRAPAADGGTDASAGSAGRSMGGRSAPAAGSGDTGGAGMGGSGANGSGTAGAAANNCASLHCPEHSQCDDARPECRCESGYEGDGHSCTQADPCQAQPCKHGGSCTANGTGFSCACANTGFTGTTCEGPIDDCAAKPCHNEGVCTDLVNDYSCACKSGWTGKQCDTSSGCDYGGTHYAGGATFMSSDGCNTCNCGASGSVVCTTLACTTSCGDVKGVSCPAGQFCDYPITARCGATDAPGTCETPPKICNDLVMPVCGCDGKTYTNSCNALSHSIPVAAQGECAADGCTFEGMHYDAGTRFPAADGCNTCTCSKDGTVACTKLACTSGTCGGLLGTQCPSDQYCKFEITARCGAADASGACSTRPDVCTAEFAPVCGCDGNTYSNACAAALAGVSVKAQDSCLLPP